MMSECEAARDHAQDSKVRDDARYKGVINEQERRLTEASRHMNDQLGLAQVHVFASLCLPGITSWLLLPDPL